jgi:hypothetical protein
LNTASVGTPALFCTEVAETEMVKQGIGLHSLWDCSSCLLVSVGVISAVVHHAPVEAL